MTGPFEKPTDIKFFSVPSMGRKVVLMDERASAAYLTALTESGVSAYRTLVGFGMYSITITSLGSTGATFQL